MKSPSTTSAKVVGMTPAGTRETLNTHSPTAPPITTAG